MQTRYIIWLPSDDVAVRGLYKAIVGEELQADPLLTADDMYCVGSSRITEEHMEQLSVAPVVVQDTMPEMAPVEPDPS